MEKDGTAVADGAMPYERLREVQGLRVIEEERKGSMKGGGAGGESTGSIQIQIAHPHHLPA